MREFVRSTIDELRRFHVKKDMRDSYGWDMSHTLSIVTCQQCGTATLAELQDQPAPQEMHCRIDSHGRIVIPEAAMQALGWKVFDEIGATPTRKGHAICLAMA